MHLGRLWDLERWGGICKACIEVEVLSTEFARCHEKQDLSLHWYSFTTYSHTCLSLSYKTARKLENSPPDQVDEYGQEQY